MSRLSINGYAFKTIPVGDSGFIAAIPENFTEVLTAFLTGQINLREGLRFEQLPDEEPTPVCPLGVTAPQVAATRVAVPPMNGNGTRQGRRNGNTFSYYTNETAEAFRVRMDMSKAEFARKMGVHPRSVGRWEDDDKRMAELMQS